MGFASLEIMIRAKKVDPDRVAIYLCDCLPKIVLPTAVDCASPGAELRSMGGRDWPTTRLDRTPSLLTGESRIPLSSLTSLDNSGSSWPNGFRTKMLDHWADAKGRAARFFSIWLWGPSKVVLNGDDVWALREYNHYYQKYVPIWRLRFTFSGLNLDNLELSALIHSHVWSYYDSTVDEKGSWRLKSNTRDADANAHRVANSFSESIGGIGIDPKGVIWMLDGGDAAPSLVGGLPHALRNAIGEPDDCYGRLS